MYTYYHLILPGSLPLRDIYFVLNVEILIPQISHPKFFYLSSLFILYMV